MVNTVLCTIFAESFATFSDAIEATQDRKARRALKRLRAHYARGWGLAVRTRWLTSEPREESAP